MNISFVQLIILHCLKKLNGERTIFSIYHLLQGKKSAQTIQDSHLFQLTNFFHTYKNLNRRDIEETVKVFLNEGLVKDLTGNRFILTDKGERLLSVTLRQKPFPNFLNGWKYGGLAENFWERLSLAIQVVSYLKHKESKYLPVQRKPETLDWMKLFLKNYHANREMLGEELYKEIVTILQQENSIDPNLLVIRLSGYRSIGLTEDQAARELKMEVSYYHYYFLNALHFMIEYIMQHENIFPILSNFLDQSRKGNLTLSTQKTYSLLQRGYSVDEIIAIRRLKQSTIEDHLVELALNVPDFEIDEYVSSEKKAMILKAIQMAKTKQLREIRKRVEDANYFEIRLVMAKFGEGF